MCVVVVIVIKLLGVHHRQIVWRAKSDGFSPIQANRIFGCFGKNLLQAADGACRRSE